MPPLELQESATMDLPSDPQGLAPCPCPFSSPPPSGPWVTTTYRSSLDMGHSLWDHDGTDFTHGRATQVSHDAKQYAT